MRLFNTRGLVFSARGAERDISNDSTGVQVLREVTTGQGNRFMVETTLVRTARLPSWFLFLIRKWLAATPRSRGRVDDGNTPTVRVELGAV